MDSERIEPPGAPVSGSPRGTDDRASRRADDEFGALIERQRGELVLYCYRLLGSWTEAEDAVQEASLRAWRARATFRGEASPRTWLHRIATRVCLDLLGRRRRTFAFAPRPGDPDVPPEAPLDAPWLEPLPERILGDRIPGLGEPELEPEARYSLRESVSLAFLAALQLLPPRQRAVLVLRDVLGWTGSETAAALETTVGAVESALHRARRTLRSARERSGVPVLPSRPPEDPVVRRVLDAYVAAWEAGDVDRLVALLVADAVLAMPPSPTWYRGREAVGAFLRRWVLAPGRAYRLVPAVANRAPGALLLERRPDGRWEPVQLHVLDADETGIGRIVAFVDPAVARRWAAELAVQ